MLTLKTLASGSSGNATLVSQGDTHILLDAGISARRITSALRQQGLDPGMLSAIFITHEHHDHISGLGVLTKKVRVPIYASPLTCQQMNYRLAGVEDLLREQPTGSGVSVGSLSVDSFPTSHDAAESVGYRISGREGTAVLCTDLGRVTPEVREAVRGCDLLVCEANHDEDMLLAGRYPYHLKRRILGDRGHLSNEEGAKLAAFAVESGARTVILAHLSTENNTVPRARAAAELYLLALGLDPSRDVDLSVAPRSDAGPTFRFDRGAVVREGSVPCAIFT